MADLREFAHNGKQLMDETLHTREIEIAAYRLVQGCLTNTIKHSEASQVKVSVLVEEGHLLVEVQHNGRPHPPGEADPGDGGGPGLVGIRERIEQLNGRVKVISQPVQGFSPRAFVPLRRQMVRAASTSGGRSERVSRS